MNSENASDKIVSMKPAQCQLMTEQIHEMEKRVCAMEKILVSCASRLHHQVSWKLDQLFVGNEGLIEFKLPENEGIIRLDGEVSTKNQFSEEQARLIMETLDATKQQLTRLNETIAHLQLAR